MPDPSGVAEKLQTALEIERSEATSIERTARERQLEHLLPNRFAPGRSGNPGGKPKGESFLAAMQNEAARLAPDGRSHAAHVAEVLFAKAMRGNLKAIAIAAKHLLPNVNVNYNQETRVVVVRDYTGAQPIPGSPVEYHPPTTDAEVKPEK